MNLPTILSRYSFSLTVALAITGGLFWIMQSVIEEGEPKVAPTTPGGTLGLTRVREDEELITKPPKREPPPKVTPPPKIQLAAFETEGTVEIGLEYEPPTRDTGPIVLGPADGDEMPIVTVAPEYPRREAMRGIEGWVIVEFAVDEVGRVRAPRVIEAQPPGVFDRQALKAVSRYKYKPRVVNGQAVPVPSRRQKIVFSLT